MRWDDTDISGMQSVFDPLYRSVGSSVIQTENLKKFMFMGKNRGIAVMLGKHDIAIYISGEEGAEILDRLVELKPEKGMVSPYMNHHFVEALLMCGKKDQAMEYMKYYWGGMLSHGADTFWELYNPENPVESPYGSSIVNSYCHAWSCTPTYLLRKYFN